MAQILLVDDEPAARWVLADLLSDRGHLCLEASDGQEALTLFRGRDLDLVLSDVLMPRMDGFRLFEDLQPRIRGRVPFVFLSGHAVRDDMDVVLASGAFGYLTKPCESAALLSLVDRALEARASWRREAKVAPPEPAPPAPPVATPRSLPIVSAPVRYVARPPAAPPAAGRGHVVSVPPPKR